MKKGDKRRKAPSNSVGTGAGSAMAGGGKGTKPSWAGKSTLPSDYIKSGTEKYGNTVKNAKDSASTHPKKARPKAPVKKSRQKTKKAF